MLRNLVFGALVIFTTNSVFGQFFLQGGGSYWPSIDAPQLTLYGLPLGTRDDGSVDERSEYWIGGGYRVNEAWSFEGFYARLPATKVSFDPPSIYSIRPISPQKFSLSVKTDTQTIGVGAVYDLYAGKRVSFIVKAGLAYTQQDVVVEESFRRLPIPPIYYSDEDTENFIGVDGPSVEDYQGYFDDDFIDDDTLVELYFAFGLRLPRRYSPVAVTATYQLISTPNRH